MQAGVPGFLKLLLSWKSVCVCICVCVFVCVYLCVCVFVCVCVCVFVYFVCVSAPKLLITRSVMWHDMNSIWLVKQALYLYMAVVISIVSRHGLTIEVLYRNQPMYSV